MGMMDGKRGVIFGIANDRSYATFITKQLMEQGAECLFTYMPFGKMERRVRKALEELGIDDPWLLPCDATIDEDLDATFNKIGEEFGTLDFLVHSIAYADRTLLQLDRFHSTPREGFLDPMNICAYSLIAMSQRCIPLMQEKGGSIVSMSYYGGEKVIPGYNVMGVAKAALEHTSRYLASELGQRNIRVNCISGGPLRTLAASAIGEMDEIFKHIEIKSPLRRNIEGEEVGNTAAFLLSDLASGITGELVHVDAGYSIIGL